MAFRLTERQAEAVPWLAGPERHKLIYGGARSGKTFFLVRAVLIRAVMAPKSRHLIARFRQNGLDPTVVSPAAKLILRRFRVRVRRGESPTFYRRPILSKVTPPRVTAFRALTPSSRRFRPTKCQKRLPQWCLCSSKGSCQVAFSKWRLVARLLGLGPSRTAPRCRGFGGS